MSKKLIIILFVLISGIVVSAQLKRLPIRNLNGKEYYVYQVQPGEGELAIAKKLGIKQQDIIKYNPTVSKGLKAYQELFFPVQTETSVQTQNTQTVKNDIPSQYIAEKGESLYGICKKFGISQDEFLKLNPDASDGIKAGHSYILKQETKTKLNKQDSATKGYREHVITQGESLYSIAQTNNCTIDDLIAANPDLNTANYRQGQTIIIPAKTIDNKYINSFDKTKVNTKVKNAFSNRKIHVVKNNETFYSIARANGISIAQLQNANPDVNILKEGMELTIPDNCYEGSAEAAISPVDNFNEPFSIDLSTQELPRVHTKNPIRLAIVLPFNSQVKPHPKHSKNYIDFLKGFMLAVDSVKKDGRPVSISIFDTGNNQDNTNSITTDSLFKESKVIITDNDNLYNKLSNNTDVRLLNIFSVRDSSYLTNRNMMQANIPTSLLIDLAVKYAGEKFRGYTPLIVEVKGATDKLSIANKIANSLSGYNKDIKRITINGTPSATAFKQLDKTKKYLIIPSTSKPEFAKELMKALLTEENSFIIKNESALFGYPEWITIRDKNSVTNLKKLDTYIYSRFAEPVSYKTEAITESHKHFYGRGISSGVPSMTLTGFDIGTYLIDNLEYSDGRIDSTTFNADFEGIQYPVSFKQVPNGGLVNTSAYIINFSRDGEIMNILIKENEI